jgi:outer membrane protein OmpA-like peptidoglycan-associated protein
MKFLRYVILFIAVMNLSAQEKPTQWSFGAGLFGNGNIYSSSFKQLSNIPNCCTEFKGAFGLGFGIMGFGEYSFKETKFPYDWKAGVSLSFGDISAKFSETANIGNVISGNSYVKGQSEYTIDVNLIGLGIEPYTAFKIIEDIPLSLKLGFQLFFPTTKQFEQAENLVTPSSNATFENNSRIRNTASGKIPEFNGALLFPTIGLKYDILKLDNILLSGIGNYYFGIHNVITTGDWKISYFNLGVTAKYQIPKAKSLPPPPPPEPDLPLPPKESMLTFNLEVRNNNNLLKNFDNLELKISRDKYIYRTPVLPILYYNFNTSTLLKYDKDEPLLNGTRHITDIVFNSLMKDSTLNLKIIHSYLLSEEKEIVESRINNFLRYFNKAFQNKFDISRLKIIENPQDESSFENKELVQEAINLKFELSKDNQVSDILYYENGKYKNVKSETLNFVINPIVEADAKPVKIQGEIEYNNNPYGKFDNKFSFDLAEKNLSIYEKEQFNYDINTLKIRADVIDAENKTKSQDYQFNVEYKVINNSTTVINSHNDSLNTFVLGFFDFDKSEFNSVNDYAIEEYKKAIEKGYEITLVSSTDNIGSPDYNRKLAQKRFDTALRLLKAKRNDVKFEYPEEYIFDNNFPHGRAYNRSVIIKAKTN